MGHLRCGRRGFRRFAAPTFAGELPGTQTLASPHDFAALVAKLETVVTEHKMAVVAKVPPRFRLTALPVARTAWAD